MTQPSHYWVYTQRIINHAAIKTHAALFTIAKTWNQPKCLSVTDWIKKMWHIYTMEYYAAITFVGTWMQLETIILSKLSQEQKTKYHMFSLELNNEITWTQKGEHHTLEPIVGREEG